MSLNSITLVIDGLTSFDGEWPSMQALQTLLSKGHRVAAEDDLAAVLFHQFNLSDEGGQERPEAILSALGDGIDAHDGWWLQADPVHMVADRDQLYLSAHQGLELTQSEADRLIAELNGLYTEDGWRFFAPSPQRWYLRLAEPLSLQTVSTSQAIGHTMGEVLPQGKDAMQWQRVMTEIQMLFHSSLVNNERSDQGKLTVSGLWFWGGGGLPEQHGIVAWDRVISSGPLARGLAQWSNVSAISPTEENPLQQIRGSSNVLCVEQLNPAELTEKNLLSLEQRLFSPLLEMLRKGELVEAKINFPGVGGWSIDGGSLRQWWRWRKPLGHLLKVRQ